MQYSMFIKNLHPKTTNNRVKEIQEFFPENYYDPQHSAFTYGKNTVILPILRKLPLKKDVS